MGVRGLTGYIARHAEQFLKPYELHDCNLIIDGDNLACNLYKDVTGHYSAFSGDYDDFYRSVLDFFHVLAECNVTPYVLMDGGYEHRKLRTVAKRLRGKIAIIKRINPCGSVTVFPTMMKEVFVDAARDSGVPIMRCVFEADDELASLSRKLNCPVLSYDSDFYIHNVRYIPLITLTMKAHTKRVREDGATAEGTRNLRKNEAKHVEKNTRANKILGPIAVDNVERTTRGKGKTYKYMDCCMYRVENLIARRSLSSDKMPLFAALLGNDYIARSSFRRFFANGMGKVGRSRKGRNQQNRIRLILQWLKEESSETALEKILIRLKKRQRDSLRAQVQAATCGYSNEVCNSYEFFQLNYENAFKAHANGSPVDDDDTDVESEEDEAEFDGDENEAAQNEDDDDETDEEEQQVEEEEEEEEEEDDDDEAEDEDVVDKSQWFPAWFTKKLYPAQLPRYCVDLIHLRKYINSPQIEHFPFKDCNEAALPILIYIFTLLHSVEGDTVREYRTDEGTPLPLEFTYLTRCTRVTNIQYQRYAKLDIPHLRYDPDRPDPLQMRYVFSGKLEKHLSVQALFAAIETLPADLQLYFLAIVYWLHTSVHCDLKHLHSLVICLIVLRTVDAKVPAERDLRAWQKRYGKIIKRETEVRIKEAADGVKRSVKPDLLELSAPDRMPYIAKSDCFLVMDRLLKHFHMQEIFKKKYDTYSSAVLHAYSELQSVVLHMNTLNGLLQGHEPTRMGQLYCGVFLYNLYDLLRGRPDIDRYVKSYVFEDSPMMYDFYVFLMDWLRPFVPAWKRPEQPAQAKQIVNRKLLKKQRQAAKKAAEKLLVPLDPNADMLERDSEAGEEEDFFDLNNKFCTFLKIR